MNPVATTLCRILIVGVANPVQPTSSKMPAISPPHDTHQEKGRLVVGCEYAGEIHR